MPDNANPFTYHARLLATLKQWEPQAWELAEAIDVPEPDLELEPA